MTRPLILLLLLASSANGQVVVGQNVRFNPPHSGDIGHGEFRIVPSKCLGWFDRGCADAWPNLHFAYDGRSVKAINSTLDEGADVYVVQPGDVFGRASVQAGDFPVLTRAAPSGEVRFYPAVEVGDEFYLGLNTGVRYDTPDARTAFGWVHLRNVDGSVTMLANAMSYGAGIVVGSTQAVPEPDAVALLLLTLAQWSAWRRYKRRQLFPRRTFRDRF